jgi:transposase
MQATPMKRMKADSQAQLRARVVDAVQAGMSQSEAAGWFKVGIRSVNRWMAQIKRAGRAALAPARRGRRTGEAGKLSAKQAEHIRKLVVGKMPDQLKLAFYLWTRAAVRELIVRQCAVKLSLSSVGNYLKSWGMSAQKPVRRAYERDEGQIAAWLQSEYPKIAQAARAQRATIYWGDESGLRSDDVRGRSFAPRGCTPVARATGKRFGCNMISALNNRGALAFQVFTGRFVGERFIEFLQRLLKHAGTRKVFLIVDGHPVHRAKALKRWVKENETRIRLFFLPGYAPELNPDDLLNHDVKQAVGKTRPRDRDAMKAAVRAWLHRRQRQPHVIRNFFQAEHVRYAA